MSKIILIVGPTAVGKTKVSIELAKYFNAEVINADSKAIYKEPLIATAKVTNEEKENIPHHLIDIASLNDTYTVFDYQKDARSILDKLITENKNVIIVGGSGLFVKALLYDYKLEETKQSELDLSIYSNEELKEMCLKIDPSNDIHVNNRQRLERFIKYYDENKTIKTKTDNINKKIYDFITIGLTTERNNLYEKINLRVDKMVESGLLDEAKDLYLKKYKNLDNIIGYKELIPYFDGVISLDKALDDLKQDTRHYAKRQYTWFNNQMDVKWFNTDYDNINNTINDIINYIKE